MNNTVCIFSTGPKDGKEAIRFLYLREFSATSSVWDIKEIEGQLYVNSTPHNQTTINFAYFPVKIPKHYHIQQKTKWFIGHKIVGDKHEVNLGLKLYQF